MDTRGRGSRAVAARLSRRTAAERALFALLLLLVAPGELRAQGAPRPNFVVILADDQRFDSLWAMPLLQQELIARGVHFREAFVTTPVCCPMRASFLSGGHRSESTNVLDNQEPNGGVLRFNDATTLATRLQASGYATGLIGKYLNGYSNMPYYVPPGWSFWRGAYNVALAPAGPFIFGSSGATATTGSYVFVSTYGTDFIRDQALSFIDQYQSQPFFLYVAMAAPHTPSTPANEDAGLFPDYLYRGRAWGEPDISDKPLRVQVAAQNWNANYPTADILHRNMLRTLQSMDRAVRDIVQRLVERNLLDNTYIIYLSDNGYLWGEHYLFGKTEPYEESIRVPMVMVAPGVAPRVDDRLVAADLDVPATIQELAGIPVESQGVSLLPLLADPQHPGRQETILSFTPQWEVWSAARVRDGTGNWKYIEWSRGSRELYDLNADPYEEQNLANVPAYQSVRTALAARVAAGRGLAVTTHFVPAAKVGQPYTAQLSSWGGVPPRTWSIHAGQLPSGLTLNPATGLISGTPTQTETRSVTFRITDSSSGNHSGGPQRYDQVLTVRVLESCNDSFDNDGDGVVDLQDPGCTSPPDTSEREATLVCDDGLDNDADASIDLADSGCTSLLDESELSGAACDDAVDNDGDGLADLEDPGCDSALDESERGTAACDDAADNDGDGLSDQADPGCAGPADASELGATACDDGVDNDGDLQIDGADPGCTGPADDGEADAPIACDDGLDNDGDGLVDLADMGCASAADPSETNPAVACDDGVDNDGDTVVDRSDPGCPNSVGKKENPECDDGLDNDGDGHVDFADPSCRPGVVRSESSRPACGVGAELALLLSAAAWIRRRRIRAAPAERG